jgi:cobyrinic acid a,c-diamide synthase
LQGADLGFIEGNVGLFDSVDLEGAHSNAALAKLLGAPVVLVVDVQGMTRGIAPLLLGYLAFDPALRIAGIILNKVGGDRHEANLRRVVEHYTDLAVLGAVPRLPALGIEERHLGLMPSNEADGAEATVERIADLVTARVDLDALERIAATALQPPQPPAPTQHETPGPSVRIGIARDDAFGFYYPDDLADLLRGGAELVPFSPVADAELPDVDALLIGGGFPEMRMRALAENASMRAAVADFIRSGRPAYAECGGLMYLTQRLHWHGRASSMCGVLHAEVAMHDRPQGRGYVRLAETAAFPWPRHGDQAAAQEIRAHEFHHSAVVAPDPDWVYGYRVLRGQGIDGRHDGIVQHNLLANYAHLRSVGGVAWTERFLAHIRALD